MPARPNDRLKQAPEITEEQEPRIYTIVSGEKFIKPGLETYYARTPMNNTPEMNKIPEVRRTCACQPVGATFCACNTVCTCNLVCRCQTVQICVCLNVARPPVRTSRRVCICVPVRY